MERVGFLVFGSFKNVLLKNAEYRHLQETYSEDMLNTAIEDLSCKLADCSIESGNHYATLTYWLSFRNRRDLNTNPNNTKSKYQQIDDTLAEAKKKMGI